MNAGVLLVLLLATCGITSSSDSHGNFTAAVAHLHHAHGISTDDVRELGLTSVDLLQLGVAAAADRVAILRAARAAAAAAPASSRTNLNADVLQDFHFVVSHFNSTRQYGKCLNMLVKYRCKCDCVRESRCRRRRRAATAVAPPTPTADAAAAHLLLIPMPTIRAH
jgi:hypothetical protein